MKLYYNPISPNCHKVLLALYEKGIDCDLEVVDLMSPESKAKFKAEVSPIGKVPFLDLERDDDWKIPESSIIIEYLDKNFPGPTLIPDDPELARRARFHDRMADFYMIEAGGFIYFEGKRPAEVQNTAEIAKRTEHIQLSLGFGERLGPKEHFILGEEFTLADISTSVGLAMLQSMMGFNLADWPNTQAYLGRCMARPSWQKVMAELQPIMAKMQQG